MPPFRYNICFNGKVFAQLSANWHSGGRVRSSEAESSSVYRHA
jgi:hypothetical protein